jgi:two-component system nitrate/nitrite response regulator NarL
MKVVIVEQHRLVSDFLALFCREQLCWDVVESRNGQDAIKMIFELKPSLVIMELMLPDIDGFAVVEAICRLQCNPRILAISSRCDSFTVFSVEKAGFAGFLDKEDTNIEQLRLALDALSNGNTYFSERFKRIELQRRCNSTSFDKLLTDQEQKVLCMTSELLTISEMAERLEVSNHTPLKHRCHIMRKLGLASKEQLLRYARDHGFAPFTSTPR